MESWGRIPRGPDARRPRARVALLAVFVAALLVPGAAFAVRDFPGSPPSESPRVNTPDDPDFDRCEDDDEDTGLDPCSTFGEEQYGSFGFSPDSANEVPLVPHSEGATSYDDCSQLDQQGKDVNDLLGDPTCAQLGGVRADTAWKYSTGDPGTVIAILDTGIRWQERELVNKVHLNQAELPLPDGCSDYDCNSDGSFDVRDYAADSGVEIDAGDTESDDILDASDLIATFSDDFDGVGANDEANGYVDDIAGWDFFDDDNDPFDASSCCSANGHGTGRAREAAAETNNAASETGKCPECQIMPLRVWDTFVVPTDFYAFGVNYAAENGAHVVEGAVGGLTNTRFARRTFEHADEQGVALMLVSSDINSANHNYPTNYNEAVYVAGSIYDSAPNETCRGPGGLPGIGDVTPDPPDDFQAGCDEFLALLSGDPLNLNPYIGQPITTSFFRNSNLTQYGGKADVVLMGSTGSENTGQASGVAGLLASFGRETFGNGDPLSGNEIRQLMTMTAEDVLPGNTGDIGLPDRANQGWDTHFGYGRVNMAAAMKRIADDRVPPEAQIDSPDWFTPVNVDRLGPDGLEITGHGAAPHSSAGVGAWELEYACGQDAADADFIAVPGASGSGAFDGTIGTMPTALLTTLAEECDGSVSNDAGRPAGSLAEAWPANPFPEPDPERHAVQIRLTVHESGDAANFGRYRKTIFPYRDDGNLAGWPQPLGSGSDASRFETGSGGEVAPRLFDLDGDNDLDVLLGTSSGELWALDSAGAPLPSWNGGQPVRTRPYALADAHGVPNGLPTPRESLRIPAIGDIDGDRLPEIVATAGEHVYAWELDGSTVTGSPGFPARIDPDLSEPCVEGVPKPCFDAEDRVITTGNPAEVPDNHIKRGIFGSPALADLDSDGSLEIVTGSMDQHVYVYEGDGSFFPGFPAKVSSEGAAGAEIVNSPAIAQLDGQGPPEIVVATNEVIPGDPDFPDSFFNFLGAVLESSTGSNPVYALHADGTPVAGWPATVGVAAGDLLPLVLPGHDAAVLDSDGDPDDDEVSISAGTSVAAGGGVRLVDGDASTINSYQSAAGNRNDEGAILNLADYSSIGDVLGAGQPSVLKGGLTVNGAANLLAVNQNLPFNHVVQAWDPSTGVSLPGYPIATDDFQLVSQPSIARVGGTGNERQALYGTGLYQLHAYGPAGVEPDGWPKFTGGWTQAPAAIGDADADGDLDVSALTREGWSFLWDTGVDACDGSNEEWWTAAHDEFGSSNYGTDARPPGTPRDLTASLRDSGGVDLEWIEPGDDWLCGEAAGFEVRLSDQQIDEPSDGNPVQARSKRAAGDTASQSLSESQVRDARFAAVLHRDEAGNWGRLASVRIPTRSGGGPGGDDGDDDDGSNDGGGNGSSEGDGSPNDAGDVGTGTVGDDGSLPFTGLPLLGLIILALALLGVGETLRRRRPPRPGERG